MHHHEILGRNRGLLGKIYQQEKTEGAHLPQPRGREGGSQKKGKGKATKKKGEKAGERTTT